MSTRISHATILTPFQSIDNGEILISDEGKILSVAPLSDSEGQTDRSMDASGLFIAPGLIDIHVHGGFGVAFGMGDLTEGLSQYSREILTTGVTGFLVTIAAPDVQALLEMIRSYIPILEEGLPGAQALGLHLEGPYLSKEKKGAFNPSWLRTPDLVEVKSIIEAGEGWIKQVTMAPELKNADMIADVFQSNHVVVALGHSNTDFNSASAALKGKFSHVTHTFNAQSSFNHRAPGVIGAVLASENITAELIADRVHVHPGAMKILYRCVGKDRLILITDAMPGAGLSDGIYDLVGHEVIVKDGYAKLADGTIAGSTARLIDCVVNVHQDLDLSINDAIQCATYNPAKFLGRDDTIGAVEPGMEANLILFDEGFNMQYVLIQGKIVYQA